MSNCAPPHPAPSAPKQNSVFRSRTGERAGTVFGTGVVFSTIGDGTTTVPPPGTAAPVGRGWIVRVPAQFGPPAESRSVTAALEPLGTTDASAPRPRWFAVTRIALDGTWAKAA